MVDLGWQGLVLAVGVAYSSWSGGGHRFYTSTSLTSGGNLNVQFTNNQYNFMVMYLELHY